MKMKSTICASATLLAGIVLVLVMTGCPNPALSTRTSKGTGSITGIVVSETGNTIAGVMVTAEQTDGIKSLSAQRKLEGKALEKSIAAQTTTDQNGSFTMSGLAAGIYTLNVSVPDTHAKAVTGVTVLEGQIVTTGTLQVRKTGDIAGQVTLSDNANPLGIVVFIAGTSFSAMTDAAGNFSMIDVPVGTGYTLVASKTGYDSSITTVDVVVRSTTTLQPMTLTPYVSPATTGSVTGVVTLSDSTDHEGIFVYLVGTSHICMTNASGKFELNGVLPGSYTVKSCKDGYSPNTVSVTITTGLTIDAGTLILDPSQSPVIMGPYFVTYDANGATSGTVPVDVNNYLQGFKVIVSGNTGNLAKYHCESLSGWNTKPDGSGIQYSPGETFFIGTSNVILYAMYPSLSTYTVTYDGNGATGGIVPTDTTIYYPGEIAWILPNVNLVRTGFLFDGWTTDLNSDIRLNPIEGPSIQIHESNVVLYALWTPSYTIGSTGPAGGIIFYDKGYHSVDDWDPNLGSWRFLEAAPNDLSEGHIWSSLFISEYYYPETPTSVGCGLSNTLAIVYEFGFSNTAAAECMNNASGGYSDWFLPSTMELILMHDNLASNNLGNFASGLYWSSCMGSYSGLFSATAYAHDIISGQTYEYGTGSLLRIRAARRF